MRIKKLPFEGQKYEVKIGMKKYQLHYKLETINIIYF